jgi:hypothetical protein
VNSVASANGKTCSAANSPNPPGRKFSSAGCRASCPAVWRRARTASSAAATPPARSAARLTAPRLDELASALAYCAARYRTLSSLPHLAGDLDLPAATRLVPLLPPDIDRRGPPPTIVKRLNGRADFAAAVRQLAPPPDPLSAVTELAEIGARLYLGDATRHPLVLLHAVTGPAALQLILASASVELRAIAFAYMWQAFAAWVAAFSIGLSSEPSPAGNASWDEIIELTVASSDEHAIKLTEACHRLETLRPSPVFRAAASDWVHRVIATRNWSPKQLVDAGIRVRLSDE